MKRPILDKMESLHTVLWMTADNVTCVMNILMQQYNHLLYLQLHFDKCTDSNIKLAIDEIYKVCKTQSVVLFCVQQSSAAASNTIRSGSPTDVLLGDGVRPSVVTEHLISEADDTVSFDVAHLYEADTRLPRWTCCTLKKQSQPNPAFCPPPATLVLMYSGPSFCRRALCTAWYSSAV